MMNHLLDAASLIEPPQRLLRPGARLVARVIRRATISTMPRWMRDLTGIRQSRLTDALVWVAFRAGMRAAAPMKARLRLVYAVSPATADVVVPAFRGDPVKDPRVVTVGEARQRWGRLGSPRELELARRSELVS